MTQNDKANLEEMVRCCRQMEAFTGRYDHICIRFYGDAMNTPALLDNCAEQLLELGRIAGQFSEAFYTQHNTTRWKEMYFRMDQSIRKNGRFSDEAVWNEMENCSRWTPELCEMLREPDPGRPGQADCPQGLSKRLRRQTALLALLQVMPENIRNPD